MMMLMMMMMMVMVNKKKKQSRLCSNVHLNLSLCPEFFFKTFLHHLSLSRSPSLLSVAHFPRLLAM